MLYPSTENGLEAVPDAVEATTVVAPKAASLGTTIDAAVAFGAGVPRTVADLPPIVNVALVKLVPVTTTVDPRGALVGATDVIVGAAGKTVNANGAEAPPFCVVTITLCCPAETPFGIDAVTDVAVLPVTPVAGTPPTVIPVTLSRLVPRIVNDEATGTAVGLIEVIVGAATVTL